MFLRIVLYVLASWLIAAHFLRADALVPTVLCLATPLLFLVRRHWMLVALRWLAYAAGAIWLVTAWRIVSMRIGFGQPWALSAVILSTVAAVSVLAGWLLRSAPRRLQAR